MANTAKIQGGNRISKTGGGKTSIYVRGASGNVVSVPPPCSSFSSAGFKMKPSGKNDCCSSVSTKETITKVGTSAPGKQCAHVAIFFKSWHRWTQIILYPLINIKKKLAQSKAVLWGESKKVKKGERSKVKGERQRAGAEACWGVKSKN